MVTDTRGTGVTGMEVMRVDTAMELSKLIQAIAGLTHLFYRFRIWESQGIPYEAGEDLEALAWLRGSRSFR
jgi:hypothetical protein